MTERILTQVQAPEMEFLRRVHGVTTRGVPRWGARNKFCASMFEPEVFRKQIYCIEENTCDLVGTFRRPGIFAPLVMSPAGAALCDKLRSCEIRRALNVELLLRTERSKPRYFCHVSGMPKERLASQVLLVKPTGKSAQRSSKDQVEWLHLRPCLVRSWRWATRTIWNCCWQWSIPSPPIGMLPRDPP